MYRTYTTNIQYRIYYQKSLCFVNIVLNKNNIKHEEQGLKFILTYLLWKIEDLYKRQHKIWIVDSTK